jgi:hypothetical protein
MTHWGAKPKDRIRLAIVVVCEQLVEGIRRFETRHNFLRISEDAIVRRSLYRKLFTPNGGTTWLKGGLIERFEVGSQGMSLSEKGMC